MKHVILSSNWQFGNDPFAAYRVNLIYGRNKRDREFLPVQNVLPIIVYKVFGGAFGNQLLYQGADKAAADKAKAEFESTQPEPQKSDLPFFGSMQSRRIARIEVGQAVLPEGKFRLIKTKEKGTNLIVPGEDTTNDVLLFVGCDEGFRGGVSLVKEGTTGEIVKTCQAGNATGGRIEVIVRLKKGETIGFYTYGRRTNDVYVYTWDGEKVEKKSYSKSEWDLEQEVKKAESEKPVHTEETKVNAVKAGDKVKVGGLEVEVVELTPGLLGVSALAHELIFADNEQKLLPNPEAAKLIKAKMVETIVESGEGFSFVDSVPEPDPESLRILREFSEKYPGVKVVSSMLSVQAFRKDLSKVVIGSITTPETARLDNPLKRIFRNKWQA